MTVTDAPRPPIKERAKVNRQKLTQLLVERMRPPAQGYLTVWDTGLPGFGVRISATGRKSWIAMYKVAGSVEVMETISPVAVLPSLADARDRARASMDKARQGIHPVKERKQQKPRNRLQQRQTPTG